MAVGTRYNHEFLMMSFDLTNVSAVFISMKVWEIVEGNEVDGLRYI